MTEAHLYWKRHDHHTICGVERRFTRPLGDESEICEDCERKARYARHPNYSKGRRLGGRSQRLLPPGPTGGMEL